MREHHRISILTRGNTGIIAGVCSGLADYYCLRTNGLRLAFILAMFFFGATILAYIVLWLILPRYPTNKAMIRHLECKAAQRRGDGS